MNEKDKEQINDEEKIQSIIKKIIPYIAQIQEITKNKKRE